MIRQRQLYSQFAFCRIDPSGKTFSIADSDYMVCMAVTPENGNPQWATYSFGHGIFFGYSTDMSAYSDSFDKPTIPSEREYEDPRTFFFSPTSRFLCATVTTVEPLFSPEPTKSINVTVLPPKIARAHVWGHDFPDSDVGMLHTFVEKNDQFVIVAGRGGEEERHGVLMTLLKADTGERTQNARLTECAKMAIPNGQYWHVHGSFVSIPTWVRKPEKVSAKMPKILRYCVVNVDADAPPIYTYPFLLERESGNKKHDDIDDDTDDGAPVEKVFGAGFTDASMNKYAVVTRNCIYKFERAHVGTKRLVCFMLCLRQRGAPFTRVPKDVLRKIADFVREVKYVECESVDAGLRPGLVLQPNGPKMVRLNPSCGCGIGKPHRDGCPQKEAYGSFFTSVDNLHFGFFFKK